MTESPGKVAVGSSVSENGRAPAQPGRACPLCGAGRGRRWHRDRRRDYFRCAACELVWVPAEQHLALAEERRRYRLHRNRPDDPAYRRFLARLFEPLVARLPPGARGLDYGSGPGPTLSVMFEEAGFPMRIFDPCFAPDRAALASRYDFVTCSEVAEHFARPAVEWRRLARLLGPGGRLGVMTQLLEPGVAFADWHYKNDPTHVCFYTRRSIATIARTLGLSVDFVSPSVVLLEADFAAP